jgi:hypothetical protein
MLKQSRFYYLLYHHYFVIEIVTQVTHIDGEMQHIWGSGEMCAGFWRNNFLGVDGRIILKWTFKK